MAELQRTATADGNVPHNRKQSIVTEEQLLKKYGKVQEERTFRDQALQLAKSTFHCSRPRLRQLTRSTFPILRWLPKYRVRKSLFGDVIAGLTVGIIHLPQGMAYASLARMPAVTGLYVSFFPVLVYSVFGTSRHISVGTFAILSLMVGAVIEKNAPATRCDQLSNHSSELGGYGNLTTIAQLNPEESQTRCAPGGDERRKLEIAVALSAAVAILHFVMCLFRLGFVTTFLSTYMVSGFTCGAAVHVVTSQVAQCFGIAVPRFSGAFAVVYTYVELFKNMAEINWATTILAAISIVFIVIGKQINERLKGKIPVTPPWELFVVIFSTLASHFAYLAANYDVKIVGEIPTGMRVTTPIGSDVITYIPDAIPLVVVAYAVSISLAAMFATKHAYDFDPNQELLAFGLANLFGSFFGCFPCGTSLSRSSIWEEAGGNSPICGVVSSLVVLTVLLWIGPLFEHLPVAALAAIIIVNLKRLLLQFCQLPTLWKVNRLDAGVWLVTWLAVVLFGVDVGLIAGFAASLLSVTIRTQIVDGETLISVGDDDGNLYRNSRKFSSASAQQNDRFEDATASLIFRYVGPLHFANKERFKSQLTAALGIDPYIAAAQKRKATLDYSSPSPTNIMVNYNAQNASTIQTNVDQRVHPVGVNIVPRNLIVDMRSCSFVDNDGVAALRALYSDLQQIDVRLMLAECTDDVRDTLKRGDFPPPDVARGVDVNHDKSGVFFVSLRAAVLCARCRSDDVDLRNAASLNQLSQRVNDDSLPGVT